MGFPRQLSRASTVRAGLSAPGAPLVALDFDCTLAVRDVMPWDLEHVFGPAERVAELEAWLRGLRGTGVTLAIVSRNIRRVLHACLAAVGWTDLFGAHVYGREDVEAYSSWHGRKSVLIRRLMIEREQVRAEDLLFVDDALSNCQEVGKHVGGGVALLCVQGKRGLATADLGKVTAWASARVALARAGPEAAEPPHVLPPVLHRAASLPSWL